MTLKRGLILIINNQGFKKGFKEGISWGNRF
jgi:hypothetical protein